MYMANLGRALTNQGWNQMILRVLSNVSPSDSVILGGFLEGISVSHSKQQALLCQTKSFVCMSCLECLLNGSEEPSGLKQINFQESIKDPVIPCH